MAVKVEVNYHKTIQVKRDKEGTLAYLSDVSGNLPKDFPGVESFENAGPDLFRWRFEKISYGGNDIQIKLLTKIQPAGSDIKLTSVPEPGTARIEGGWHIGGGGGTSEVTFDAKLSTELPLPFLLKAVIGPLAQRELSKLFDRYMRNVESALSA